MIDQSVLKNHEFMNLTLDNGQIAKCKILTVLEANQKDYIVLLPEERKHDGEVYVYEFVLVGEDDFNLGDIVDPKELENVLDAFDIWMERER